MCKMTPLVGKDITEKLILPRFCKMCCDCRMFHVRKVCAANFGDICSVVGQEATEEMLLPRFFQLCSDNVWGVRKACAECFMAVSCATSQELRRTKLSSLFINLISDPSRWVRQAAFQSLGPFISTFANPSGFGQSFKEEDAKTVVDETFASNFKSSEKLCNAVFDHSSGALEDHSYFTREDERPIIVEDERDIPTNDPVDVLEEAFRDIPVAGAHNVVDVLLDDSGELLLGEYNVVENSNDVLVELSSEDIVEYAAEVIVEDSSEDLVHDEKSEVAEVLSDIHLVCNTHQKDSEGDHALSSEPPCESGNENSTSLHGSFISTGCAETLENDKQSSSVCNTDPHLHSGSPKVMISDLELHNCLHYWRTPIPDIDLDEELLQTLSPDTKQHLKCQEDDPVVSLSNMPNRCMATREELEEMIENLEPHVDDPDVKGV